MVWLKVCGSGLCVPLSAYLRMGDVEVVERFGLVGSVLGSLFRVGSQSMRPWKMSTSSARL